MQEREKCWRQAGDDRGEETEKRKRGRGEKTQGYEGREEATL